LFAIMADTSHIRLGILTRPYGLDGGMRLRLDHPVMPMIATPCDAEVGYSSTFTKPIRLLEIAPLSGQEIRCRFERITTPEAGEELAEMALYLPRERIGYGDPYDNPGLIGYSVVDQEGAAKGEMIGFLPSRAHPVWRIVHDEREWLLPAVDEFVKRIDHEAQRIEVALIPGLYAEDEAEGEEDE